MTGTAESGLGASALVSVRGGQNHMRETALKRCLGQQCMMTTLNIALEAVLRLLPVCC
jgi:hypothetical protein